MDIIKKHTNKHYDTNNPTSVIFHIDLGTEKGTTDWILNGPKSVSYNYYITRKGQVIEFVHYKYGAWHAGVVHNPNKRASSYYGKINPNLHSIGICYEGRDEKTNATESQIGACRGLLEWLSDKVTIEEYFAHCEIADYKPKIVLGFKDAVLKKETPKGQDKGQINETPMCKLLKTLCEKYGCNTSQNNT